MVWKRRKDALIASGSAAILISASFFLFGVTQAASATENEAANGAVAALEAAPSSISSVPAPDLPELGITEADPDSMKVVAQVDKMTYWAVANGPDVCLVVYDGIDSSAAGCRSAKTFEQAGLGLLTSGTEFISTEGYLLPAGIEVGVNKADWEGHGAMVFPRTEQADDFKQQTAEHGEFFFERIDGVE